MKDTNYLLIVYGKPLHTILADSSIKPASLLEEVGVIILNEFIEVALRLLELRRGSES